MNVTASFVHVVIINFYGAAMTVSCVDSVLRDFRDSKFHGRLTIFDNTPDGAEVAELSRKIFSLAMDLGVTADCLEISVRSAGKNLGFGGGIQAALQDSSQDFIILLNNDAVVGRGFFSALLAPFSTDIAEEHSAGIGATTALVFLRGSFLPARGNQRDTPLVLRGANGDRWLRCAGPERERPTVPHDASANREHPQVLINSTGNLVDSSGNGYDRDFLLPAVCLPKERITGPSPVWGLYGGACAVRDAAWRQVGGLRTDLFLYYEDTDLSYKLRAAGWQIIFTPGALAWHEHSASTGAAGTQALTRWNTRGRLVVTSQHAALRVVCRAWIRSFLSVVKGANRLAKLRGIAEALRFVLPFVPDPKS